MATVELLQEKRWKRGRTYGGGGELNSYNTKHLYWETVLFGNSCLGKQFSYEKDILGKSFLGKHLSWDLETILLGIMGFSENICLGRQPFLKQLSWETALMGDSSSWKQFFC